MAAKEMLLILKLNCNRGILSEGDLVTLPKIMAGIAVNNDSFLIYLGNLVRKQLMT